MNKLSQAIMDVLGVEAEQIFEISNVQYRFNIVGDLEFYRDDDWEYSNITFNQMASKSIKVSPWKPKRDEFYWTPDIHSATYSLKICCMDGKLDEQAYNRGLVFRTEDEAIAKAKRMLEVE